MLRDLNSTGNVQDRSEPINGLDFLEDLKKLDYSGEIGMTFFLNEQNNCG